MRRLALVKPGFAYALGAALLAISMAAHYHWPSCNFVPRTGALLVVLGIVVAAREVFRGLGPSQGPHDFRKHEVLITQGASLKGPEPCAHPYNDAIDAERSERQRDETAVSVHGPTLAIIGTLIWGWADLLL